MIKIIDRIDLLNEIKSEWDDLLSLSIDSTPFQSHEFITSSWHVMNTHKCTLYVMIYSCDKDNEVQAIFPFYIDSKGLLRFINDRHVDFCDAIILNKVKHDYHLWDEINKYISLEKRIRGVMLCNLMSSSLILSYFHYFLSPSVIYCHNAYARLQIDKANEFKHFSLSIPYLNGSERKKIRYWSNRLKDFTLNVYSISKIQYPKELIRNITEVMISKGWRDRKYLQLILPIVEKLYDQGLAELFVTFSSSLPVAVKIFLRRPNNPEYISWLLFYIEMEYNQYNMIQSVEYFSKDGGVYNFARGTYGYKMKMFRPVVHNLYTLRWSRSIWGQLGDLCAMNLYHVKQIVKKIIRK